MNEVKQIRIIQLTASLLLRMNSDIEIEQANTELYDFVIITHGDKSRCRVRVVDDEFFQNGEIEQFFKYLYTKPAWDEMGGYPLCLVKIDEQKLALNFQVVARDEWGEYGIDDEIHFEILDIESLKWLIGEIRKWNHIISILDRDVHGVIKSIGLDWDTYGNQIPAKIIYIRDFSADYKMNPQKPSNAEEAREKQANIHMQKEYPKDVLDDAILNAVKSLHPEAQMRSDLLITTDQYKALLRQQKIKRIESAEIRILPEIGAVPPEQLAWIGSIEALRFEVDIFADNAKEIKHLYDNEGFEVRLPINGWVNTLNRYSQVLRTLHRVSDVIR